MKSNLSEDEIIRDWSVSDDDKIFIKKFSPNYQLWIYLQLCSLRLFGQLLDNPNNIDNRVIAYACKILQTPIIATVKIPNREATKTDQKKQIFQYLGFSKFEDSLDIFQKWLQPIIDQGFIIADKIILEAESFLISKKILLPKSYQLKKIINSYCRKKQDELYKNIFDSLPKEFIAKIDEILQISEKENISWFQKFKEYPGSATITLLNKYLAKYQKLMNLELHKLNIIDIPTEFQKHLFKLARYYDSWQIKRFSSAKRYSLMLAFLIESKKSILDYIIEMHDQYISGICRECNNTHESNLKKYKKQNERAISKIESFIDYALSIEDASKISINDIFNNTTGKSELIKARNHMRQYKIESKHGYANLLINRYNSMRRYFAEFINLPFRAESGSENIIKIIDIIRKLDQKEISKIPNNTDQF